MSSRPAASRSRKNLSRRSSYARYGASWFPECGAHFEQGGETSFKVWAPRSKEVRLKLSHGKENRVVPMVKNADATYTARIKGLVPGTLYSYVLANGKELPDPASRYQPEGVHGPSCLVDHRKFPWSDGGWKGVELNGLILYEIHTGTFTPEGTFESVIPKIPYLRKLGVNCLEIMPVAQFPGARNWGYDGVNIYSVQNTYGGPGSFKKLVNACHAQGMAVCLDVVYNHLGPEGNSLHEFGPYFSDRHHTPWGQAINYDGPESDHVRNFFVENALYWITEYHVDALRLDAIHGIYDFSARHVLEELNDRVKEQAARLGRKVLVIAESDLNDSRILRPKSVGGYGLDAQWSDDFHHTLHVSLTGEKSGYYGDFTGLETFSKAIKETFVYDGRYSSSRRRTHGNSVKDIPAERFVVSAQNHDQIGNRAFGDRLSATTSFSSQKLTAAVLLFSPYTPLIFMGQEYGEKAPFQYFISLSDPRLVEAVRKGRRSAFVPFGFHEVPDPKSEETFHRSMLNWSLIDKGNHRYLLKLYQDLIALRKSAKVSKTLDKRTLKVHTDPDQGWVALEGKNGAAALFSFSETDQTVRLPFKARRFQEILNTESSTYGGTLEPAKTAHKGHVLLRSRSAIIGRARS